MPNSWIPSCQDTQDPARVATTIVVILLVENFRKLCQTLESKMYVPTTSRNPAVNGVCEQIHQTVANVLRTLVHTGSPHTLNGAKGVVDGALATTSHAVRANVSTVSGYYPGALTFHRDMLLDVPIVVGLVRLRTSANWQLMKISAA